MKKIFDPSYIIYAIPDILQMLPLTLELFLASLFFGLILGLFVTYLKLKKNSILSVIASAYVSFIRGTPSLVLLFIIYYGLPQVLKPVGIDINDWSKMVFAIITFSLNSAAYLSEIMRSSYLAIDIGQQEAAYSIGMSGMQTFIRIILPQAFAIALPNLGNSIGFAG